MSTLRIVRTLTAKVMEFQWVEESFVLSSLGEPITLAMASGPTQIQLVAETQAPTLREQEVSLRLVRVEIEDRAPHFSTDAWMLLRGAVKRDAFGSEFASGCSDVSVRGSGGLQLAFGTSPIPPAHLPDACT